MSNPAKRQNNPFVHIDGIRDIAARYNGFIIDLYGVLHDGETLFPGTLDCLIHLRDTAKHTCLLSNSPTRSADAVARLECLGLPRELYSDILTSGELVYRAVSGRIDDFHRRLDRKCWFIGEGNCRNIYKGLGEMLDGPDEADFVLNAIPGVNGHFSGDLEEKLQKACDKGLPMICANPDLVVNIGGLQFACAGTYAKTYEKMGGEVVYHGKPHSHAYDLAWELLDNMPKERILAIGDSLHTDIQGANAFGCDSIFNLTGIHWEEVKFDHTPAVADREKVEQAIAAQKYRPNYVMNGFSW